MEIKLGCCHCQYWEKVQEDDEVWDWGLCHLLIVDANYQLWWNQQSPETLEGLIPPGEGDGFEVPGCSRICEGFKIRNANYPNLQ